MARWFPFLGRRIVLSGDVMTLRFIISARDDQEFDQRLRGLAYDLRDELEAEVRQATWRLLGSEFEVRSIVFGRSSLEILVAIGTAYYVVSRYKNFIESVQLLISQLKSLFERFFRPRVPVPIYVNGDWLPGPGLVTAGQIYAPYGSGDPNGILLIYLILSHAALLALFIWMVLRKLQ